MTQTRKQSAFEQAVNIVVGFSITLTANMLLFPLFGWEISAQQNVALGVAYTVVSFVRGYGLRRFFNWWDAR